MRRSRPTLLAALVGAVLCGACSSSGAAGDGDPEVGSTAGSGVADEDVSVGTDPTATPPSSAAAVWSTSTSTTSTISTSTTSTTTTPTTTTTTTLPPGVVDLGAERLNLGLSVEGRPIIAERLGEVGGRRALVIGVIHGDEDDGVVIVDELRTGPVPEGVELWVVESMNPDGQAAVDRHNANQVDLNRNFPYNWGPIGEPGDPQYAGPGPASEPETRAMIAFIEELRPDIVLWYHQDLFVVAPSTGRDGRVRERYAELSGLPMGGISGGTYTGIAATWASNELDADGSVAFIVELGATLSDEEAATHADAVRTIAAEG